jgi:hypothetical protein
MAVIVALCALAGVAAFFVFAFLCRSKAPSSRGKQRIGRWKKNRSTTCTRDDDDDVEHGLFTMTKDAYATDSETETNEEADETETWPLVLRPGHVNSPGISETRRLGTQATTAKPLAWSPVVPAVSPVLPAVSPVGEPSQPPPVLAPALAPHDQPGPVAPANSSFRRVALRRGVDTEVGLGLGQEAVMAGVGAAAVDPPPTPSAALPFGGRVEQLQELYRQQARVARRADHSALPLKPQSEGDEALQAAFV